MQLFKSTRCLKNPARAGLLLLAGHMHDSLSTACVLPQTAAHTGYSKHIGGCLFVNSPKESRYISRDPKPHPCPKPPKPKTLLHHACTELAFLPIFPPHSTTNKGPHLRSSQPGATNTTPHTERRTATGSRACETADTLQQQETYHPQVQCKHLRLDAEVYAQHLERICLVDAWRLRLETHHTLT